MSAGALLTVAGVVTNPGPAAAAQLQSPASASAVPGRRTIVVSWTAPTAPSVPVARYRATATSSGDSGTCDATGALTCTISTLTAGAAYTVGVVACPNASTSDATDCSAPTYAAAVVRPGPPGTPVAPTVVFNGDPSAVRLTWAAPDPGAGIASYRITPSSSADLTGSCGTLVTDTTCDFGGLHGDTAYTFRVTAIGITNSTGSTGTSATGAVSAAVVAGLPHKPTNVTATRAGDTSVTVDWDRPSGNQALSGYAVTTATSNGGTLPTDLCRVTADKTECLVTGLDANKSYTFTVDAWGTNQGAGSGASDPSTAITPGLPGAPSTPTVDLGPDAGDVTVSWDAPSEGGTVSGYTVTPAALDGGTPVAPCTAGPTTTHCAFTGLQDGKSYHFKVTATGTGGTQDSDWSDPVVSQLPSPPATPTATLGDAPGKVELAWNAATGGGPVVYYTVTAVPAGGGNTGTPAPTCGFNLAAPTCEIAGLDPAKSYTFTVTAIGDLGSATSSPSAAILPDKPGTPTSATVALGAADTATVSWLAPTGGGAVATYTATATPADGTAAITAGCTGLSSATLTCTFSGLDPTTTYAFTVTATNAAGHSDATATPSPSDVPSAPQTPAIVLGTGAPGTVDVNWTAPAQGTVSRYLVKTATTDGGTLPAVCQVSSPTLTCHVTGLQTTRHYTFTVRAQNILGGTDAAATSPAIVPDKPGAPGTVSASAGPAAGQATVTWNAPTVGGTVTTYTVTPVSADGGDPVSPCTVTMPNPLSCAFTGLTAGKSYTFTVNAANASGNTDAAPTDAIISALPDVPTGVTAILGDTPGKVTVSWDLPTGGPATNYRVTAASTDGQATIPSTCATIQPPTRTCTFTGLTTASPYTFTVRAENALGGNDSAATPALVPDKAGTPASPSVTLGNAPGTVTVTWSAPAGGGAVSSYAVTPVTATGGATPADCASVPSNTTTCTFTTLTHAASYTFNITATNVAGTSVAATTAAIVPDQPDVPAGVTVTLGGTPGTATVTWSAPTGAAVTGYTVTPASTDGGTTVAPCTTATSNSRSCAFTGLTTTASYAFTVEAANAAGVNDAATTAIVANKPAAPTSVAAVLDTPPGTAVVTWNAPLSGGVVATYTVTPASAAGGATIPAACTVTPPATRSCRFTGLDVDKTYTFTVTAGNASGSSDAAPTTAVLPNRPGTPGNVVVALGDVPRKATITWDAPATGGAVSRYTVTPVSVDGDTTSVECASVLSTTTTCTFTTLTANKSYTFDVRAVNAAGTSDAASTTAIVPNQPDTPAGVTVTLGNTPGAATVAWDAPTGATVTGYTVTAASPDGGTLPPVCTTATSVSRSCTFNGLTTVASYTFTVRAVNAAGYAETATNPIVPNKPNAPGAPTAQVLAADTARITWAAPTSGGLITKYTVTAYTVAAPAVPITSAACTEVTTVTCDFGGLTEGNSYTFTVTAVGPGGTAASASSTAITTAGPGKPAAPTVAPAGPRAVTVTWAPPANTGPITGYSVTSDPDLSAPARCTNVLVFSCVFDRLVAGTAYRFKAVAYGTAGRSTSSDASVSIVVGAPGTPDRPTVTPTAVNGLVVVSWVAPPAGGTVTGYQVQSNPGQFGCATPAAANATSCPVSGLSPTTSYTFQVKALGTADGGDSAFSPASDAMMPITTAGPGTPAAPTVAPAGPRAVTVTWAPPAGGGLVTGYSVTSDPDLSAPARCTNVLVFSCVFDRLAEGTAYRFKVVAYGTAGRSTSSAASVSIVVGAPRTPDRPTVTPTEDSSQVMVTWVAPPAGGTVAGYQVQSTPGQFGCAAPAGADATSCVVSGLSPTTGYTFQVKALGATGGGDSALSPASDAITPGAPGGPTDVAVAAGDGQIDVSWTAPQAGAARIGHYRAQTTPGGFFCETATSADTECVITGVRNLTSYTVTVTAVAADGSTSPAGKPSAPVRPTAGAPGSPTGVQAAPGDGSTVVTWTAPASAGNGIARYVATATGTSGPRSCSAAGAATLTCTITGLTNGQPYTVTVVGVGVAASGYSAPSAAVTVTPRAAPGVPTNVTVTGGVKTLVVRWTAGSAGDGLSGFTATATGGTSPLTCTAAATATTCSIAGVTPGAYAVTVVAKGTVSGIQSAATAAVTGTALFAAAPTLPSALPAGSGTLTLSAATVRAGGRVTVTGTATGFAPFTAVTLGLYPGPATLATVTTDANGGFSQEVTIPTTVAVGSKTLVAGGLPPTGTVVRYRTVAVSVQSATSGQIAAVQRTTRDVSVLDRRTA